MLQKVKWANGSAPVAIMVDDLGNWILLILAAIVILGLWKASRPKWTTVIVLVAGAVKSHRGLPQTRQREILDFLAKEVPLPGRVTIRARRYRDGYLRTHVAGRVDEGTRQRIRNFLVRAL